jgi:hypothetical protein
LAISNIPNYPNQWSSFINYKSLMRKGKTGK